MPSGLVWPLVGRDEELAAVAEVLADPTGPGLIISGVAGSGKTRLVMESRVRAAACGIRSLHVTASRAAATIPMGVFAPLLPARAVHDPFEGLQGAADALRAQAGDDRLVLAVDDAHLLDPASAALVHHVYASRVARVLVTVRSDEPLSDAVTGLWKDLGADRLHLQDLSVEDTLTLLEGALGADVDVTAVQELWRASAGNPLFLREMTEGALADGALAAVRGVWTLVQPLTVPGSVQELVRGRLVGLTDAEREALYTVAFAHDLGLALLEDLYPDVSLDRLERDRLLVVGHDGRRRPVSLAHPLYGEVLRSMAPATTAITVTRRLTSRIEEYGARRREDPLRVATWQLVTGGNTPPDLLTTAAQQAHHAGDIGLAEQLVRAARTAGAGPAAGVLLGQLLDERGEHDEAEQVLCEVGKQPLPDPLLQRAALTRADNLYFGLGDPDRAAGVLEHAVGQLEHTDTGELVANAAWIQLHAGDVRSALKRATTVPASDRHGSVAADIVRSWALTLVGDTGAGLQAAGRAGARHPRPAYPAVSRHTDFPALARCLALHHGGRLRTAEQLATWGLSASLTGRPPFVQARWAAQLGAILLDRGRAASATTLFRQAAVTQRRLRQPGLLRASLAGQAMASIHAGDAASADAALDELDGLTTPRADVHEPEVLAARAWVAAHRGERSRASGLLCEAATVAHERGLISVEIRAHHDRVRIAADPDSVTRLTGLVELTDSASAWARAHHAQALTRGSAGGLHDAAVLFERLGLDLLAAEAYAHAAMLHRTRGHRAAQACWRRATELAHQCEEAQPPTLPQDLDPAPLTAREREVVTMAARGLRSRDIAEDLVVSVRTVHNLLQRAYIKLGVHSRAEAAAALGLEPEQP